MTRVIDLSARVSPLAFAASFSLAITAGAMAQDKIDVTVEGLANGVLSDEMAFCIPDEARHQAEGDNVSPALSWTAGPEGTQSYAVLMVDPDVPAGAAMQQYNKAGTTIPADAERQNFYHWVLVDIPATATATGLAAGADSAEVTFKGKPIGETENGVRGVNDYTKFMTGEMAGQYGGYDGPCPPWNDERMHNYAFRVFALDVPSLNLSGAFTGPDAEKAMQGHILAQGEVVGTYTMNPALR